MPLRTLSPKRYCPTVHPKPTLEEPSFSPWGIQDGLMKVRLLRAIEPGEEVGDV